MSQVEYLCLFCHWKGKQDDVDDARRLQCPRCKRTGSLCFNQDQNNDYDESLAAKQEAHDYSHN